LRLTLENEIVVLEANPNPNLDRTDEFAQSAIKAGLSYEQVAQRILNLAFTATH
jgi:D-alanine-D-alanine ligase